MQYTHLYPTKGAKGVGIHAVYYRSSSLFWPPWRENRVNYNLVLYIYLFKYILFILFYYRQKKSPGHAGCSSGYNSALYQDVLDPSTSNTSGREQTNSLLDKIATSLKSMNYVGYMTTLRVFFGLRNLKNKNVLWV